MSNSLKQLGINIAAERERRGLTQNQLAEATGVKQGTVSSWEGGRIDIPYSTLCKIAGALNTSPARLCDKSIPMEESPAAITLEAIRGILSISDPEVLSTILEQIEYLAPRKNLKLSSSSD